MSSEPPRVPPKPPSTMPRARTGKAAFGKETTLAAHPAPASRYLRPQDLRRFRNFQFAARMVVEGFYTGKHRSPFHDASAEFADYRPYVPGDEIRSLDW